MGTMLRVKKLMEAHWGIRDFLIQEALAIGFAARLVLEVLYNINTC